MCKWLVWLTDYQAKHSAHCCTLQLPLVADTPPVSYVEVPLAPLQTARKLLEADAAAQQSRKELSAKEIRLSMTQAEFRAFRVGNMTAVTLCTMCLVGVGLLLLISGAVVTGIVYTEVRPPTADENYDRYRGADLRRVLGPLMLCLGGFLLIGGCVFMAFGYYSNYRDEERGYSQAHARDYDSGQQPRDVKVSTY